MTYFTTEECGARILRYTYTGKFNGTDKYKGDMDVFEDCGD